MAKFLIVLVVVSLLVGSPLTATQALAAGPIITVDGPSDSSIVRGNLAVLGWAVDRAARAGTGIEAIHVYLDGVIKQGKFLGAADYGLVRQDVAQALGAARFANSGFQYPFDFNAIAPGEHSLYIYARTQRSGWSHVRIKVIIESEVVNQPGAYQYPSKGPTPFLAPPPGLPIAGAYSYPGGQTKPAYGAPPPPPTYTAAAPGQPYYGYPNQNGAPNPNLPQAGGVVSAPAMLPNSPAVVYGQNAWNIATGLGALGDAALQWDDVQYLGVGETSGAHLYALMLNPNSTPGWLNQSWDARYDWTLRATQSFTNLHNGGSAAFMLMTTSIEPAPPPGDSKWAISLGQGPYVGSYQVGQVLAYGIHRPGQGFQIDLRPY